jgi:hypothetical protein
MRHAMLPYALHALVIATYAALALTTLAGSNAETVAAIVAGANATQSLVLVPGSELVCRNM